MREITNVSVKTSKKNPEELVVKAKAWCPQGAFNHPQLVRRIYVMFPEDGIQDYDFEVDAPPDIHTEMIKKLDAEDIWMNFPKALKGVRIHSRLNQMERMI